MIKLHRSEDRRYVRDGAVRMWKTFDPPQPEDPSPRGFRGLDSLNEVSLPFDTGLHLVPDEDRVVVTYVREGGLLVRNKPRRNALLMPGWYQCASSLPRTVSRMPAGSTSRGTRFFICSMKADPKEPRHPFEQKQIPFSDRHGQLRRVASPGGEDSCLRLPMDARMYSCLPDEGQHIVHELGPGRGAWLHVIEGRIQVVAHTLDTGDAASFEDEAAVSFSALEASEILLFDLA